MKCQFSKCTNEAVEGEKYCAESKANGNRCRFAHNTEKSRRKKGQLSRAEAIATLEPRTCVCGTTFQPTEFKQTHCSVECRTATDRTKKREKEPEIDLREVCLDILDRRTVLGKKDVDLFPWTKKEDYFATDKRWDWTKRIIEEAKVFLAQEGAMSLRSLFYHLVHYRVDGKHNPTLPENHSDECEGCTLLTNTKAQYAKLADNITTARERGDIPNDAFPDNVRESITHISYTSAQAFKQFWAPEYKVDLWENQNNLIVVVTEKDTLVSVLENTNANDPGIKEYRVPLHVLRGQGSTFYMDSIAKGLCLTEKPIKMFYLGDHDPAGYVIEDSARHRLYGFLMEEHGWDAERVAKQFTWKRIGFLPEDFEKHDVDALEEDDKEFALDKFVERFHSDLEQCPEGASKKERTAWCKRVSPSVKKAELEGLTPTELRRRTRKAIEDAMGKKGWEQRKADLKREEAERKSLVESW